jgi:hypothetical protein
MAEVPGPLKVLAVGDIVGAPGRKAVLELLPALRERHGLDLVIANAENAAGGSGLTPDIVEELLSGGCACLTTGDHVYRNRAVMRIIDTESRLIRPSNISHRAAGRGWTVIEAEDGTRVAVINLQGQAFMGAAGNPFEHIDQLVGDVSEKAGLILVDFHAEATAEKAALGHLLDGRVSAVWGTHTHVQTADERVLPGGTGYITDLGMTGGHDGVIGRRAAEVVEHLITDMPTKWEVTAGDLRLCGAIFTLDRSSGHCLAVERIQQALPD